MDTWGGFSLTLVDALDTLVVMGNTSEFNRAVQLVLSNVRTDANVNVSVFETNIRVVAGLLSAHMLSVRVPEMTLEPGWPCSGPLLRLAEKLAQKLLPAFNTDTGMPFGTVNLKYGVHRYETPITCTAGVGTFILEFGALSRLTGNTHFERIALKALDGLWKSRSNLGLVGNHINVKTGAWTATDSGIGAGVDSYFEYLAKGALLLQRPRLMRQFYSYVDVINRWIRKEDWFMWVTMTKGQVSLPIFQSLEAFWPGLLTLVGDVDSATRIMLSYQQILAQYGFPPEFYNIPDQEAVHKRTGYPLRPEIAESLMYLYRATEDGQFLQLGADIIEAIEHSARTECGYATVVNVKDHTIEDRMESFFLAETTKYLYLLFDPDNFLHNDGLTSRVVETPSGNCVIEAGGYIFNTEAHPLDPGIIHCCSAKKQNERAKIHQFQENVDLVEMLGFGPDDHQLNHRLINEDIPSEMMDLLNTNEDSTFQIALNYAGQAESDDEDENDTEIPEKAHMASVQDVGRNTVVQALEIRIKNERQKDDSLLLEGHMEENLDEKVKLLLNQVKSRLASSENVPQMISNDDSVSDLAIALQRLMRIWNGLAQSTAKLHTFKCPLSSLNHPMCPGYCYPGENGPTSLHSLLRTDYGNTCPRNVHWNRSSQVYSDEWPPCVESRLEEPDDGQAELRFGSFRYKSLAEEQFRLWTSALPPFRSRFTGMGQVVLVD